MNDDILNQGCIYKFLSNFYFLPLFSGLRNWSRVVPSLLRLLCWAGTRRSQTEVLLLMHDPSASLPRAHLPQTPTFFKWKINQKQNLNLNGQTHQADVQSALKTLHVWVAGRSKMLTLFLLQSGSDVASNRCEEAQLRRRREGLSCTGVSVPPRTSHPTCPCAAAGWGGHLWPPQRTYLTSCMPMFITEHMRQWWPSVWGWRVKSNYIERNIYSLKWRGERQSMLNGLLLCILKWKGK